MQQVLVLYLSIKKEIISGKEAILPIFVNK